MFVEPSYCRVDIAHHLKTRCLYRTSNLNLHPTPPQIDS